MAASQPKLSHAQKRLAINMALAFSILFFFLITYVSTTNVYMYYLLLVLLKIRDIFLT